MKLRVAKKVCKQAKLYYPEDAERIWGKATLKEAARVLEKHNPRHRIFLSACSLYQKARQGKVAEAKAHWASLRGRIIRDWLYPEDVTDESAEWGRHVAEELDTGEVWEDLEYYSDRWCYWRVVVVDVKMEKLK